MARQTTIDELMFPVELRPVYTDLDYSDTYMRRIEIPNSRVVVNADSGYPLGVVSSNYRLVTNEQALEMGRQCCEQLFGTDVATDIDVFTAYAPSTRSYCHIDLIHKNYVMNVGCGNRGSEVYTPYIRVTNSYNRTRALRFDVGFCRKLCLNGVIFEAETIDFTFTHSRQLHSDDISFGHKKDQLQRLFEQFQQQIAVLRSFELTADNAFTILCGVLKVKSHAHIDRSKSNNHREDYDELISEFKTVLNGYIDELGSNAYALFNTITDIASRPPENRYFRRDVNSLQRTAGSWLNSFQGEIRKGNFKLDMYMQSLR